MTKKQFELSKIRLTENFNNSNQQKKNRVIKNIVIYKNIFDYLIIELSR